MLYKPELTQDANSGKTAMSVLAVMLPTFRCTAPELRRFTKAAGAPLPMGQRFRY
jgi:hypothetical protein